MSLSSFTIYNEFPNALRPIKKITSIPLKGLVCFSLVYLAISGIAFWLSDIIPATLNQTKPESIKSLEIPVNVASVFDLAFTLPLLLVAAMNLWKERVLGLVLAVILLGWLVITSISVVCMEIGLHQVGLEMDLGKLLAMAFNGSLSLAILTVLVKKAEFI